MANILYEIEVQRSNITPKAFFNYCKKAFEKNGQDIENWIDYEDWINPTNPYDTYSNHEDWDEPAYEVYKSKPYEFQLFLSRNYNLIIEFDFWDDKKGFGYMYAIEYER